MNGALTAVEILILPKLSWHENCAVITDEGCWLHLFQGCSALLTSWTASGQFPVVCGTPTFSHTCSWGNAQIFALCGACCQACPYQLMSPAGSAGQQARRERCGCGALQMLLNAQRLRRFYLCSFKDHLSCKGIMIPSYGVFHIFLLWRTQYILSCGSAIPCLNSFCLDCWTVLKVIKSCTWPPFQI